MTLLFDLLQGCFAASCWLCLSCPVLSILHTRAVPRFRGHPHTLPTYTRPQPWLSSEIFISHRELIPSLLSSSPPTTPVSPVDSPTAIMEAQTPLLENMASSLRHEHSSSPSEETPLLREKALFPSGMCLVVALHRRMPA